MEFQEKFSKEGLTFDDVLLIPAHSEILPDEADTRTVLAKDMKLNIPIISAAMDTVTESRLAIALAREGGLGVIHRNMSIKSQAAEVDKVKRSESVVVKDPVTIGLDEPVSKAKRMVREHGVSGFPVVDTSGRLVGLLTHRDLRFEPDSGKKVRELMTPLEKLVTVPPNTPTRDAKVLLHEKRIEKLPVVDENGALVGLMTFKDIEKSMFYPKACKDERGRLRVGAAVGVSPDTPDRVAALVDAGADAVVVDTANGFCRVVLSMVARLRNEHPALALIAGNVVTPDAVEALCQSGADAVKVGIGPSAICTTRVVSGVGVPQLTAIFDCASAAEKCGVPLIADGGIKYSGDIAKAIGAGADCVMIGNLFAGTEETPGEIVLYEGRSYKAYRGMGSLSAMKAGGKDRYFYREDAEEKMVPQGIEGMVPYKGSVSSLVCQLIGGLAAGMGYLGTRTIEELKSKARFVRVTASGLRESHPHGVMITREAPNYQTS
ncbi:MAG: IMP dehydrogenase [Candidatus Coatesbacteria bacterium]|nr:IMP dehydrogenase [Candidatus Coatesbacteria bacterium]